MKIKWQLRVTDSPIQGKNGYIHSKSKVHCYIDGHSLCGKYYQNTDFYNTDIPLKEIEANPDICCKKCYAKYLKRKG